MKRFWYQKIGKYACIHFRLYSENFHSEQFLFAYMQNEKFITECELKIKNMLLLSTSLHRMKNAVAFADRFYFVAVEKIVDFFSLFNGLVQFDYLVIVPFFHPSPREIIGLYIIMSEYNIFSVNHLLDLCNCNTITLGTERHNTLKQCRIERMKRKNDRNSKEMEFYAHENGPVRWQTSHKQIPKYVIKDIYVFQSRINYSNGKSEGGGDEML